MGNKHRVGRWVCTQLQRVKDTSQQRTPWQNCALRGPRRPGRAHSNRLPRGPSRLRTRYCRSPHCAHRRAPWLCRRAGTGLCTRGSSLAGTRCRDCCAPCGSCHKQDLGPGRRWAVVANTRTGYTQICQKSSGRLVVWVCTWKTQRCTRSQEGLWGGGGKALTRTGGREQERNWKHFLSPRAYGEQESRAHTVGYQGEEHTQNANGNQPSWRGAWREHGGVVPGWNLEVKEAALAWRLRKQHMQRCDAQDSVVLGRAGDPEGRGKECTGRSGMTWSHQVGLMLEAL